MVSGIGPKATLDKLGIPVVADRSGVGQNLNVWKIKTPSLIETKP